MTLHYKLLKKINEMFSFFLSFNSFFLFQKKAGFLLEKVRFKRHNGYYPKLKNPSSFNEKCIYVKLFNRNKLLPLVTDKYCVREYVRKKIGDDYLVPILQVASHVEDIDFEILPNEFIIKTNFTSGKNILVRNKKETDLSDIKRKLCKWMSQKYGYLKLLWFAQLIERKITIENLLTDKDGNIPVDYKFFVFNGSVKMIQVDLDRYSNHTRTLYDENWDKLNVSYKKLIGREVPKPQNFEKMKYISSKLGEDFSFVRVDLYCIMGNIYFGELTPYPENGNGKFEPKEFDFQFGKYWKLNKERNI